MTYVYMCLYKTTFVTKSTSGRVHYQVHKWTSSSHRDALKLSSLQVDEVIIQSKRATSLLGPQVDMFIPWGCLEITKSTSGRVHPIGMH